MTKTVMGSIIGGVEGGGCERIPPFSVEYGGSVGNFNRQPLLNQCRKPTSFVSGLPPLTPINWVDRKCRNGKRKTVKNARVENV